MPNNIRSDTNVTTRIHEQTICFTECYTCGLPVAITTYQKRQYDESGMAVTCAMGHITVRKESENTRLGKELSAAQGRLSQVETTNTNLHGLLDVQEKKNRKLLKRIEAGVCPHCHRTFQGLRAHIERKHGSNK